jgi:thiol-disulfide isomerase/thioredoxin
MPLTRQLNAATQLTAAIFLLGAMNSFAGCGLAVVDGGGDTGSGAAAAKPSKPEVELKILSHDNFQQLVAGHKGKVVVVDVWSTTCPPCVKEFPGLVALHKQHGPDKVACVSLSLDYIGAKGKPPEAYQQRVLEFLRSRDATFDNALASESADELLNKLELGGPPAVYVYDRDGNLAKRFDNDSIESEEDEFTYKDVNELVAKLVAGAAAE